MKIIKGCVKYEGAGKSVFSLSEEFTNKTMGIYFLILLFCFVLFSFVFQPDDVEIGNRNDFLNRNTIGKGLLDSFRQSIVARIVKMDYRVSLEGMRKSNYLL